MLKPINRIQEEEAFIFLAHELKGSASIVLSGSQELRRFLPAATPAEAYEVVEVLEKESQAMADKIDQMSRLWVSPEAFFLEPILVQRVIPGLIEHFQEVRPGRTVHVDLPAGLPIAAANSFCLQAILSNLLENADKYSDRTEPVEVTARTDGKQLQISVRDRGPGVDERELDAIFDLFHRSQQVDRRANGQGVGLYLCRRLVTLMGGSIWAQLPMGRGLLVTFSLPALDTEP